MTFILYCPALLGDNEDRFGKVDAHITVKQNHHIDPEEVTVKGIVVSPVHPTDVKPLSHQKARELIIAISHFMGCVPPEAARIENIGSGQDQASSLVQQVI